jgi:hypothetical protein
LLFKTPAKHYVAKFAPNEKIEQIYHVERPGSVLRTHLPSVIIAITLFSAGIGLMFPSISPPDFDASFWYSLGSAFCFIAGTIAAVIATCYIGGEYSSAKRTELVFTNQCMYISKGVASSPDGITRTPYETIIEILCHKFDEHARNFMKVACKAKYFPHENRNAPLQENLVSQVGPDFFLATGRDDSLIRTWSNSFYRVSILPIEWLKAHGVRVRLSD